MKRRLICLSLGLVLLPAVARADVAVPVVSEALGSRLWSLPMLAGVILLEALIVWIALGRSQGFSFVRVLGQLAVVNGCSTLLGMAWTLLGPEAMASKIEPLFFELLVLTVLSELPVMLWFYRPSRQTQPLARWRLPALTLGMNALSYLLMGLLLYAGYRQQEPRAAVLAGIRSLEGLAETYGANHGVYAPNTEALVADAQAANYWYGVDLPAAPGFFRQWPAGASMLLTSGQPPRALSVGYRALKDKQGRVCGYELYGYQTASLPLRLNPNEPSGSPCP